MKGKYFTTDWIKCTVPVTNQIDTDKSDNAFADKDIVFDWTAIDIPKGTHKLMSAAMHVQGTHSSRQAEVDFQLWFAKSIDDTAPPSLGTPNSQISGTGHRKYMLGVIDFDATSSVGDIDPFNSFYQTAFNNQAEKMGNSALVVEGEPSSGTNVGYDKIYVAGMTGGALNFSTNVLLNQGGDQAATTTETTLTVDGGHATKVFEVGDVIQAMDLAEIGTIQSLTTTSITVDLCEDALTNNDEILSKTPVKIRLAFEQ